MFLQTGRGISRLRLRPLLRCAMIFTLSLVCGGQEARAQVGGIDRTGTGGRHTIKGRILSPSGRRADIGLKVRLESTLSGDLTVLADANGSFSFQSLRPGTYRVVIEGNEYFETATEIVTIESDSLASRGGSVIPSSTRAYSVQIYLRPKIQRDASGKPGVINAALASVPKPAVELYNKAVESVRKGDNARAVEQLKSAIALYPDFPLALSELGVQYLKLEQPDKAIETLRAALKLSPDDYATLLTYGIALFQKKDFAEAETHLRRASKKNQASPSAHFYLGLTLIRQRKLDDAEKELQQAVETGGDQMSLAHYYLAGLYWGRRDYNRAASSLETYLRLDPKAPDAQRVRATIKELRSK